VIVKAESFGWTSPGTIALFLLALGLLALFTQIERRTRWPLMPLGVFRLRGLTAANGVQILIGAAFAPAFYFLALYFQQVLGYSALEAGLAYLPLTCGMIVSAGLASKVATRFGVRPALVLGLLCVVAAMLMLAQVTPTGSFVADVLPASLVFAAGLGLTWIPTTIAAMQGVPKRYAGLASGLFNTSFQVGGALGLAILSALAAWRTSAVLDGGTSPSQAAVDGYRLGFYVAAGTVVAIIVLIVPLFPSATHATTEAPSDAVAAAAGE
jgi:predicted MFS family arabinose efflux permease